MLNEVTITAKKIIKGSKNLNGAGNADIILDQKDMEKAKKIPLSEYLPQQINGFREKRSAGQISYLVYNRPVMFVIDGVYIDTIMGQYPDKYLDYITAEDVRGVEFMSSGKYRSKYLQYDLHMDPLKKTDVMNPTAYIEITTWSGHGAYMGKTPGTYLYKPMPFLPAKIYR